MPARTKPVNPKKVNSGGRPHTVPVAIKQEAYRLWCDGGYTAAECAAWVCAQGHKITTAGMQSYFSSEKKRREVEALGDNIGDTLIGMYRNLQTDIARHHAEAGEIWRKMPDYQKNTARAWKAVQDVKQNAIKLTLQMHEMLALASKTDIEDDSAKESLAQKLKLVLDEDTSPDGTE